MATEKKVSIKVAREKTVTIFGALTERTRRELKEELERLAASDYRVSHIRRNGRNVEIQMAKVDDWSVDELLDECLSRQEAN